MKINKTICDGCKKEINREDNNCVLQLDTTIFDFCSINCMQKFLKGEK